MAGGGPSLAGRKWTMIMLRRGREFAPAPLAVQAEGSIVSHKRGDERGAGELAALIGIHYFRQAMSSAEHDNSSNDACKGSAKAWPASIIALRSHRRCDRARRTRHRCPVLTGRAWRAVSRRRGRGSASLRRWQIRPPTLQQFSLPLRDLVCADIEPFNQLRQRVLAEAASRYRRYGQVRAYKGIQHD